MSSVSLIVPSAASRETVGSINICQVKSARYFEAKTVTAFGLQRSGRFLWLEPSGKASGGGWGLSQHCQDGNWVGGRGHRESVLDRGTERAKVKGQKEPVQRHRGVDELPYPEGHVLG